MTELFGAANSFMAANTAIALVAAFVWGILSVVLSPCHLASIALLIGYLSLQQKFTRRQVAVSSVLFALGMLLSIVAIGAITVSLGRIAGDIGPAGNYIVAAVFVITGLILLDVIPLPDWKPVTRIKSGNLLAVLGLGLIVGFALGPCTFAFMAPVLGLVFQSSKVNPGFALAIVVLFALGHCGIITLAGSMTTSVQKVLNWHESNPNSHWFRKICGILVIAAGIYFMSTGK